MFVNYFNQLSIYGLCSMYVLCFTLFSIMFVCFFFYYVWHISGFTGKNCFYGAVSMSTLNKWNLKLLSITKQILGMNTEEIKNKYNII